MKKHDAHIDNIVRVARIIQETGVAHVFTGGAVVSLLLTDPAAQYVRPTDDVDVIVAVSTFPYRFFAQLNQ